MMQLEKGIKERENANHVGERLHQQAGIKWAVLTS